VFRRPDGRMVKPRRTLRREFQIFPSETVYEAFDAPSRTSIRSPSTRTSSATCPYPAGAFVARNRRIVDFIAQEAAYVFDLGTVEKEIPPGEKLRALGKYILEGSKPGSAAAAVHVTHEVLPLHDEGFGRLLKGTLHASEAFYAKARQMREKLLDDVHLGIPFETDSHLICLALNPRGNHDLATLNRFGRRLFREMKVDPRKPVQVQQFIGSYTSLFAKTLSPKVRERLVLTLGIDPTTFVEKIGPDTPTDRASDHVFLLRHTLMNPWLQTVGEDGETAIDRYWDWLADLIHRVLAEGPERW
jgi:hypothetical protein